MPPRPLQPVKYPSLAVVAINNLFFAAGGLDEAADMSKGAMGQRVLHDIKLETYTPRGERMYNTNC